MKSTGVFLARDLISPATWISLHYRMLESLAQTHGQFSASYCFHGWSTILYIFVEKESFMLAARHQKSSLIALHRICWLERALVIFKQSCLCWRIKITHKENKIIFSSPTPMIFPIILDCCLSHWLVGHPKARTYYGNSLLAPSLECLKEFSLHTRGLKSRPCQGLTVHVAGKCYPCHSWGHLFWPQETGNSQGEGWGVPFPKRECRLVILHVCFTGEHRSHFKAGRRGGVFIWMRAMTCTKNSGLYLLIHQKLAEDQR